MGMPRQPHQRVLSQRHFHQMVNASLRSTRRAVYLVFRIGIPDPEIAPGPPEIGDIGPWSTDGRSVFTSVLDGLSVHIFRRDLATGRRTVVTNFSPADPAGIVFVYPVVAADGRSYIYNFARHLSNLYVVDGLR